MKGCERSKDRREDPHHYHPHHHHLHHPYSIMKTLCFILGLMLLCVCCCDAISQGASNTAPIKCCFKFSKLRIPQNLVKNIVKTDSSCEHKAFIVKTIRREFCVKQSTTWAQNVFSQRHNSEGSGQ